LSLSQFSIPALFAGLAAIAAALFLLQRLRVRFQQVDIVTTLFWRQAQDENRTRVLTQRFRHIWVYLFLLAISSLLWLAASGLQWDREGQRDYLLVLDGSMAMTSEAAWSTAVDQLQTDVAALPVNQREVWLAQTPPLLLLQKGEHEQLLLARLTAQQPKFQRSQLGEEIHRYARRPDRRKQTQVRIYGRHRLSNEAEALLPAGLEIVYRTEELASAENRGLLAAGLQEAASGTWDRVDFLATVHGETQPWTLQLNGQPSSIQAESTAHADGSSSLLFVDLPARGQRLDFELTGTDQLQADNHYSITLPQRTPIRIFVADELQATLASFIQSDSGLVAAPLAEAEVIIRGPNSVASQVPSLTLTSASATHAFEVRSANYQNADDLLTSAMQALAMQQIDGLALAQSMQREVSLGVDTNGPQEILMWQALLDPEHGFVHSKAFPQFLARAVRWLHGDSLQANRAPTKIGASQHSLASTSRSLKLDADATLRLASPSTASDFDAVASESNSWPLWTWLALVALALLMLEWAWFQNGRLP
jgi:hypothetical protein